jgi:cyclophilin family peptidyl-prolyl cis-trans isomerase
VPIYSACRHEYAPIGAERFVDLTEAGFFTDLALFRCVKNFIVQTGMSGDKSAQARWEQLPQIKDDHPVTPIPFKKGMLSYGGRGDDSRHTSFFITFTDSEHLGKVSMHTLCAGCTAQQPRGVSLLYAIIRVVIALSRHDSVEARRVRDMQ